ncbi:hypothetical protein SASPL_155068 [Salvia splendens]|uniref:Uncharacterized protein n=1 Tax=Salvia splendens TaxID=180675 RepID=A0A8X8Z0B3_SALSN|nr:hypothetical protein SASPL_155068 [Salvia splendens]
MAGLEELKKKLVPLFDAEKGFPSGSTIDPFDSYMRKDDGQHGAVRWRWAVATAAVTHDGAAMRERKEWKPEDGERQRHREFEGETTATMMTERTEREIRRRCRSCTTIGQQHDGGEKRWRDGRRKQRRCDVDCTVTATTLRSDRRRSCELRGRDSDGDPGGGANGTKRERENGERTGDGGGFGLEKREDCEAKVFSFR